MAGRDVRGMSDMGLMDEWRSLTWGQRIGFVVMCAAFDVLMVALSWVAAAYL